MDSIIQLHNSQTTQTKRDLYYQNPQLFGSSQATLDKLVDDIACSVGVSRRQLRIVAKCKGVLHGDISLQMHSGERLNLNEYCSSHTPYPINPNIDAYATIDVSRIQYVLVVEKDAIFSRLSRTQYAQRERCLLVTGKGYPDVATRLFLSRMARENPQLPILCLVDGDPYGVDIFLSYKYGSMAMNHQREELTVPSMEWIGLELSRDYERFNIPPHTMLDLGAREAKKAHEVCDRMMEVEESCIQSVEIMLRKSKKAEIEALCSLGYSFLSDVYLPQKVQEAIVNRMVCSE